MLLGIVEEHDPELDHVRRAGKGQGRDRRPEDQEARRVKGREKGLVSKMSRLYREVPATPYNR